MPVLMNNPIAVPDLSLLNDQGPASPTMTGEGYVWKFAVELERVFENAGPSGTVGATGFLVDELRGIILANATVIETIGLSKNIEFTRQELL